MNDFEKRLRAIEAKLNARPGTGRFFILLIEGCLPTGINFARAGTHHFERAQGEELGSFVERAAALAKDAGELQMTVGGLPPAGAYAEYRTADGFDFDRWWDECCAEWYDEVPPVTEGYIRRSPTW